MTKLRLFALASIVAVHALAALGSASAAPREPSAFEQRAIRVGGLLENSPAWESYRRRFVQSDGRVMDTGNGGVSHSEGQGYAMLLATAAGDRDAFASIWAWTRSHLFLRGDHLAVWRWSGAGHKPRDLNNASDGDLLIAWALAEAADYWSDADYLDEARLIAKDILRECLRRSQTHGRLLLPGTRGFAASERDDGPVVNLSYWVFPAFARLAIVEPSKEWRELWDAGLTLLARGRFGAMRLPPDWLSLSEAGVAPAEGFDARSGYDAMRIPLYLYWVGVAEPGVMTPFADVWPADDAGVRLVSAKGDGPLLTEPGYRAVAALARCSALAQPFPDGFYRFQASQHYYPATLHLLSILAAAARGGSCVDRGALNHVVSAEWRATPALRSPAAVTPPAARAAVKKEAREPAYAMASFAAEADSEYGLVFYFRALGAAVVIVAAIAWLFRRGAATGEDGAFDAREDEISRAVAAIRPGIQSNAKGPAPRNLPFSPFTPSSNPAVLGSQIEVAAEASVRLGRTVGLIYFEAPTAASDADVHKLVETLRRSVRPTDHVALLDQRRIVVCICLLASATDLEGIGQRLSGVAQRIGVAAPDQSSRLGYAMYPLDAYDGVGLIDAATADFVRRGVRLDYALPAVQIAEAPPKPTRPRKRRSRKIQSGESNATA